MSLFKLGFKTDSSTKEHLVADLAAGAAAGTIANAVVAPLDTVGDTMKSNRFLGKDIHAKHTIPYVKEMYNISKEHNKHPLGGIRGFYRGMGVKILKGAPFAALSFMAYELLKDKFRKQTKKIL
jgi:hypothetical protein